MARKKGVVPVVDWAILKLSGKTIVFAGRFEKWGKLTLENMERWVRREGATIVDAVSATVDFLVMKDAKGSSSHEKKVMQLNAKGASIRVMDTSEFAMMLTPSSEEVQGLLLAGADGHALLADRLKFAGYHPESAVRGQRPFTAVGLNLAGQEIKSIPLWCVDLEGADLSKTTVQTEPHESYSIGTMSRSKLDDATIHATFPDLIECSCRGADLSQSWVGFLRDKSRCSCDFSKAKLVGFHFIKADLTGSNFEQADLTKAELRGVNASRVSFRGACLNSVTSEKANFTGADFTKADLTGAELLGANFTDCNLTGAKLCNATLMDARFQGACVDGADFTGANTSQANFTNVDVSKAIGLSDSPARNLTAGPKLQDLSDLIKQAKSFETTMEVQAPTERLRLSVSFEWGRLRAAWTRDLWADTLTDWVQQSKSVSDAMIAAVSMWPQATPLPQTITATGVKTGLVNKKLKQLAMEAWCETYGIPCPVGEELDQLAAAEESRKNGVRASLLADFDHPDGVERWNARSNLDLQVVKSFPGVQLPRKSLDKVRFYSLEFDDANFEKASLVEADLQFSSFKRSNFKGANMSSSKGTCTDFDDCDFTSANLSSADFSSAKLPGANFNKADLKGINLSSSRITGTNFTGAKLKDCNLTNAEFDENTLFPKGFEIPDTLRWKGKGLDPRALAVAEAAAAGPVDMAQFMKIMEASIEKERMKKALSMLKAERFRLFAEATSDHLVGVVKSQNDPDLVYSCRLTSAGEFGCCTQNLNPCGGLRGSLCKHLLVLIIGMTNAGDIDPSLLNGWIAMSRLKKPELNKDQMSETLLRYKGAEAGEIDWRPTETIPEDYFAL